jgi:heat shock protein HslJ
MPTLRRSFGVPLIALSLVLTTAACSSSGASPAASGSNADLSSTSWKLVDIGGATPAAGVTITLAFDANDAVSGSSGCNNYAGQPTIDGSKISFGPLAGTRMACPEPAMSAEAAYLAALDGVTSWRMQGSRLVLEGATTLTYDPA